MDGVMKLEISTSAGTGGLASSLEAAAKEAPSVVCDGAAAFASTPKQWSAWRLTESTEPASQWSVVGPNPSDAVQLDETFDLRVCTELGEFRWRKRPGGGQWSLRWIISSGNPTHHGLARRYLCRSGKYRIRQGQKGPIGGFWVEDTTTTMHIWVRGEEPPPCDALVLEAVELVPTVDLNAAVVDEIIRGFKFT